RSSRTSSFGTPRSATSRTPSTSEASAQTGIWGGVRENAAPVFSAVAEPVGGQVGAAGGQELARQGLTATMRMAAAARAGAEPLAGVPGRRITHHLDRR